MTSLPVIVSRSLGCLTDDAHRAAGAGQPSLAVWSNVLRCVGPEGIGERQLPAAARISRRLAVAAITGSVRRTWITNAGGHLVLAPAGRAATARWPPVLAELDAVHAGVRAALEPIVSALPLELPHYPASYGAADPSAVGAPFVGPRKAQRHGVDWRPVPRTAGVDTVSGVPVTALLSQALMAFTMDYEERFPWPLASTLTVLRHVGTEPRPLADVPGDHGIAGNGKSLLERHLIVSVTRDPADAKRKLVALTDRGTQVLHHHPTRLAAVDADWRKRFGDDAIDGLHNALAPIADPSQPDYVLGVLHHG